MKSGEIEIPIRLKGLGRFRRKRSTNPTNREDTVTNTTPTDPRELIEKIGIDFARVVEATEYPKTQDEADEIVAKFAAQIERDYGVKVRAKFDLSTGGMILDVKLDPTEGVRINASVEPDDEPTSAEESPYEAGRRTMLEEIIRLHEREEATAGLTAKMLCVTGQHYSEAALVSLANFHGLTADRLRAEFGSKS